MRVRADFGGPSILGLGTLNDLRTESRGRGCGLGEVLIGGEPRVEGFTDEADQRADAQRQKRDHLFDNTEPGHHVLRIDRGRSHPFIEQERHHTDDDTGFLESLGLAAHRSQQRQRLAGIIGDVDHRALRPADQLRGQIRIDLIERAAFAGEDQLGTRLQQRQLDRQQKGHVIMDTIGERQ
jgi:hypothetical protein